jgi:hypothetical protein
MLSGRATIGKRLQTDMQHNDREAHQETPPASFFADDLITASHADLSPGQQTVGEQPTPLPLEGERMSLSLLRRRVRAGWYQDDLHSQEANHLIFLRWLVRSELMSEWTEEEE